MKPDFNSAQLHLIQKAFQAASAQPSNCKESLVVCLACAEGKHIDCAGVSFGCKCQRCDEIISKTLEILRGL